MLTFFVCFSVFYRNKGEKCFVENYLGHSTSNERKFWWVMASNNSFCRQSASTVKTNLLNFGWLHHVGVNIEEVGLASLFYWGLFALLFGVLFLNPGVKLCFFVLLIIFLCQWWILIFASWSSRSDDNRNHQDRWGTFYAQPLCRCSSYISDKRKNYCKILLHFWLDVQCSSTN